MTTVLHLVRHAEQRTGAGPDAGLSELGREQARCLGERLASAGLAEIHHGPAARASETAQVVARTLADRGLPEITPFRTDLLADRTPAPEPGQEQEYPERDRAWLRTVPRAELDPGGRRISAALRHFAGLTNELGTREEAGAAVAERHVLLVTHAFVVSWIVREVRGGPVTAWLDLSPSNTGRTVLRCAPGEPVVLVEYNDIAHCPSSQ